MKRFSLLLAAVVLCGSFAYADNAAPKKHHPSTRPSTQAAVTPYPLKTCIVSGEEFGGDMGDPVVLTYEGREMKFCCSSCVKKFKKDPAKYIKALDEKAKQPAAAAPAK